LIFAQDLADLVFQFIEIPFALITDDGAQQRINLTNRIQNIVQQKVLLSGLGDLLGHLDQVTENRAFRTQGDHGRVQCLNIDLRAVARSATLFHWFKANNFLRAKEASITASATFGHSASPDNVTWWHTMVLQ